MVVGEVCPRERGAKSTRRESGPCLEASSASRLQSVPVLRLTTSAPSLPPRGRPRRSGAPIRRRLVSPLPLLFLLAALQPRPRQYTQRRREAKREEQNSRGVRGTAGASRWFGREVLGRASCRGRCAERGARRRGRSRREGRGASSRELAGGRRRGEWPLLVLSLTRMCCLASVSLELVPLERQSALVALALSSRFLNALSTPLLYDKPRLKTTRAARKFGRTYAARVSPGGRAKGTALLVTPTEVRAVAKGEGGREARASAHSNSPAALRHAE